MLSRKTLLPMAIVAGLVAASPAPGAPADPRPAPAHAAGDPPAPALPAIVRTRVKRTEGALDRLGDNVDDDDAAGATKTVNVIRRQMNAAWRGVKYTIKHAPPPVAEDDRFHRDDRTHAHASGDAPAGSTTADPATTALAVFQLQDDVVSGIVALTDGASDALLGPLATALTFALDRRDDAIEDVHTLAPPTPPAAEDDDAFVPPRPPFEAHTAGDAPTGSLFGTVMPAVPAMLDDELQQIRAILEDPEALLPAGADLLRTAAAQIAKTERKAKAYWPPVAADEE
jgi:hypothetical protein